MTTLREARATYFAENDLGDGGYDARWVRFKLGPLPMAIPNTPSRRRAVPYHDLHHVLTGYGTDLVGEFEISAWEIASGCRDQGFAWLINLSGMAAGLLRCPRATLRAFVRGRHTTNLYGERLEDALSSTVREARSRTRTDARVPPARLRDAALWLLVSAAPWLAIAAGAAGLRSLLV